MNIKNYIRTSIPKYGEALKAIENKCNEVLLVFLMMFTCRRYMVTRNYRCLVNSFSWIHSIVWLFFWLSCFVHLENLTPWTVYLLPTISEMLYEVVRILRQIYNKFNRNIETSDMVCFVCGKELHLKWRLALFIKNIQLFKNIFRQFFCHLHFWIIQSTKLNLKRTTKCWLDKTDNSNRTMFAFTRKVLNWHDKVDD